MEWRAALLALEAVQGAPAAAVMPMAFDPSTLRETMMFATRTADRTRHLGFSRFNFLEGGPAG